MQSKKHSILESITNVIVGLVISFLIQLAIYPILNIPVTLSQNIIITIVFFIASFVRGYVIRRIFNKIKWTQNKEYELRRRKSKFNIQYNCKNIND